MTEFPGIAAGRREEEGEILPGGGCRGIDDIEIRSHEYALIAEVVSNSRGRLFVRHAGVDPLTPLVGERALGFEPHLTGSDGQKNDVGQRHDEERCGQAQRTPQRRPAILRPDHSDQSAGHEDANQHKGLRSNQICEAEEYTGSEARPEPTIGDPLHQP